MVGLEPSILRRVPSQIYPCKLAVAVVENSPRRRHSVAATQQIAHWLKKLGMSEYADRFVENRIDLSVLPDLTDQDLEKLGVLLGDRRNMRAIRGLGDVSVAVTALSAPKHALVQDADAANYVAFNGDALRELAAQFLALAEKRRATVPLMIGRRIMGSSLLFTGNIAESRSHFDQAIALYDPAEHRPLATRFGQDVGVFILSNRSFALWMLGYPDATLADIDHALKYRREIEQAATLMYALNHAPLTDFWTGNYAAAATLIEELIALSDEKGALFWNALGKMNQGCGFILTGKASSAIQTLTAGIAALRSTGSTMWMPMYLPYLATAYAELHQFDEAWCRISEAMTAMENTKEILWQVEVHRTTGEIALMSPELDAAKVEAHFERARAISVSSKQNPGNYAEQ
jgi:tetratricopeptide (TPR) repeat protein